MKYLVCFLAFLFLLATKPLMAQSVVTMPLAAGDTVTNTGTASKVIGITAGYQGIVIQAKATEVGSVTSAGTIKLQGSLDGVSYDDISGQTYTVTDVATQVKSFYVSGPLPRYIKVLQTGSGTMVSVLSVKYQVRFYSLK